MSKYLHAPNNETHEIHERNNKCAHLQLKIFEGESGLLYTDIDDASLDIFCEVRITSPFRQK